jgi:signal transduction histidine kinase
VESPTDPWPALADADGGHVGWQFRQPGLASRAVPFALVALVATISVLVPFGHVQSWWEYAVSVALLLACAGAFLLPWQRLPSWAPVLVPLLYTVSILELILASGVASGVGLVLLVPLIWSVLFHRRWESACVVVAVVAVQAVSSIIQATPDAVIVRRLVLWSALSVVIAVAAHGLRDRIRDSLTANAALQEEVSLTRERDRIAADLRESVVRKIFNAGLDLHGAAAMIDEGPARGRLMHGVAELDGAIRSLRESVFAVGEETDADTDATTDASAQPKPEQN